MSTELARIAPGPNPQMVAEYVPILVDSLADSISQCTKTQQRTLALAADNPTLSYNELCRQTPCTFGTLQQWLHRPLFRSCFYSIKAVTAQDSSTLTVDKAKRASPKLIDVAIAYGERISDDAKPSEVMAKLKAQELVYRVGGLYKEQAVTTVNIGLMLKEAAAKRLEREPNREAWE